MPSPYHCNDVHCKVMNSVTIGRMAYYNYYYCCHHHYYCYC